MAGPSGPTERACVGGLWWQAMSQVPHQQRTDRHEPVARRSDGRGDPGGGSVHGRKVQHMTGVAALTVLLAGSRAGNVTNADFVVDGAGSNALMSTTPRPTGG